MELKCLCRNRPQPSCSLACLIFAAFIDKSLDSVPISVMRLESFKRLAHYQGYEASPHLINTALNLVKFPVCKHGMNPKEQKLINEDVDENYKCNYSY